jgi:hypothetical protein
MHNRLTSRLLPGLLALPLACGGEDVGPSAGRGDTIPPMIASLSPAAHDTGIDLRAVIEVTFSEPVNPATIAPASFYLRKNFTPALIPLAFSYQGRTATATPDQPFDSLTVYLATITRAVRDSAGNQLVADTTWEFRTRAGPVSNAGPNRQP